MIFFAGILLTKLYRRFGSEIAAIAFRRFGVVGLLNGLTLAPPAAGRLDLKSSEVIERDAGCSSCAKTGMQKTVSVIKNIFVMNFRFSILFYNKKFLERNYNIFCLFKKIFTIFSFQLIDIIKSH